MQSRLWGCVEVVLGEKGIQSHCRANGCLGSISGPMAVPGEKNQWPAWAYTFQPLVPTVPTALGLGSVLRQVPLLSNTNHFLALLKQYPKYLSSSASEHAIRQNADNPGHRIWYGLSLLQASLAFCPQICHIYLHHVLRGFTWLFQNYYFILELRDGECPHNPLLPDTDIDFCVSWLYILPACGS